MPRKITVTFKEKRKGHLEHMRKYTEFKSVEQMLRRAIRVGLDMIEMEKKKSAEIVVKRREAQWKYSVDMPGEPVPITRTPHKKKMAPRVKKTERKVVGNVIYVSKFRR